MVVGALKPSITFCSLGLLQLAPQFAPARSSSLPSLLQLTPQFAPACSPVCSSSLPSSLQLTPTFPHSPLHPTGGGDPNTYMAIWSEMEQAASELEQAGSWDWAGSELGAGSELEQADFGPMVGTYKGLLRLCEWTLGGDFTSRWWGHISRICHNGSWSELGAGTSWE